MKKKRSKKINRGSSVKDYSIICKMIDKDSFKLTKQLLENILYQSKIAKKLPLLILNFKRNDKEKIILEGFIKMEKT